MSQQRTGNIGLFYVCYRLSRLGWNVLPTSRNAKGIDLLTYSEDGTRRLTFQVKSLAKRDPVPLGSKLESAALADYWIICRRVLAEVPECFVLTPDEVYGLAQTGRSQRGEVSYWLQPRAYEADYRENWDRIGSGLGASAPPTPTLDELLAGVADGSTHGEVNLGQAVGREVWRPPQRRSLPGEGM